MRERGENIDEQSHIQLYTIAMYTCTTTRAFYGEI